MKQQYPQHHRLNDPSPDMMFYKQGLNEEVSFYINAKQLASQMSSKYMVEGTCECMMFER